MISPSIGRVVWYHPPGHPSGEQPWPALISYVHNDQLINVGGFRADGTTFDAREVFLQQDPSSSVPGSGYASWMPYQQKVAAEAQAKIAPVLVPISKSTS